MEFNEEKFEEKLKEFLGIAKKKKGIIEYSEVSDFFKDMELDSDHIDKVLSFLEANGVDVFRVVEHLGGGYPVVVEGPLGLDTVIGVGGNLELAEQVAFKAEILLCHCAVFC